MFHSIYFDPPIAIIKMTYFTINIMALQGIVSFFTKNIAFI